MAALRIVAALVLFASGAAGAVSLESREHEPHERVKALPEIGRVGGPAETRFVIRGRLPAERARRLLGLARAIHADVTRRFLTGRDKTGLPAVDVCLLGTTGDYRAFVDAIFQDNDYRDDRGFYAPYHRLVVVDLQRGIGSLKHELVHPLVRDDLRYLPDWLDEGLASLYVSTKRTKAGLRFLVNFRLHQLRAALSAGHLPTLQQLAASDDRDVYGKRWRAYYSLARHLLLYLDRRGKLDKFVRAMCKKPHRKKRQLAVLKRFIDYGEFLAWTEKLRIEN